MGGFMTARGTGNLLTRTTAILAVLFLVTSVVLAMIRRIPTGEPRRSSITLPPVTGPATTPAPGAAAGARDTSAQRRTQRAGAVRPRFGQDDRVGSQLGVEQ